MIEGGYPPDGDLTLSALRTVWRRDAGRTIPNVGRLASIVELTEDGERISIFASRGFFRFEIAGRRFRVGHLSDAESVALSWLLRGEGR